jgi:hypothetical protein
MPRCFPIPLHLAACALAAGILLSGSLQASDSSDVAASPLAAEGRIYFCDAKGKTTVIAPGDSFQVLAENALADGCMASPAVVGKALILRTKTSLYRIEN